jgi:hypothetical protein
LVLVVELLRLRRAFVEDAFLLLVVLRPSDVVRLLDYVLFIGESRPTGIEISAHYVL